MATEIEQLEHDAVADESRSLTFRSRGTVYIIAGVLLLISIVLAALRVGEQAGRLSDWQALRARSDAGLQRAPPDLVVRTSDPRPVARRLEVPRRASGFQQDLRRRPPPRNARRRRRLLLERRDRLSPRLHRGGGCACDPDRRRAARGRDRDRNRCLPRSPARSGESAIERPPRPALADLRSPSPSSRSCSDVADRRPEEAPLKDLGLKRVDPDRRLADPRADARRLALRDHDHDRPLLAPRPRRGRTLLVPAADPDRARRRASTRA